MLNDSAITLFIDKNGRTKYDFHVKSYNDRYVKNDDNIDKEYVAYYKLDVFDNNDYNDNANDNMHKRNSKGICTISLNHINSYSILFNDITCSIYIIGKYSKNYCKYCYQRIIKKAYQRDDCSRTTNLTYCSMDCMNKSTYYLDTCHEIINNIYNHDNHNYEYFMMLSMNYLYNYSICSSSDERKYRSILELESHNDHHRHHHLNQQRQQQQQQHQSISSSLKHGQQQHHIEGYRNNNYNYNKSNNNNNNNNNSNNDNNNCSSVDEISTVNSICLWFLQQLQQYAPKLLIKLEKHYDHLNDDSPSNKRHLNDRNLDFHFIHHHHYQHHHHQQQQQLQQSERFYLDIIIKLFYIIKYNTQKLSLYETKDTNILCLLPNISRINHSCQPNCMLTYYSIEHTICSLKSSLIVEGGSDDVNNNTNSNKNPIIDDSTIIIDYIVNGDGDGDDNGDDCDINKVSSYQIMVSVVALRPIAAHEEITMSYIEPLCLSYDTRQELLWNGFQFNCKCSRCKLIECSSYDITIVNNGDDSGERDGNDIFNSIVTMSSKDNKYRSSSNSNGSNSSSSSSNIMESDDYHLKISIDSLIERASKDGSSVSSQVSSTYLLTVLYVL